DDELTRARTFQRPLVLVMVKSKLHVSRWASQLRARLRPVDRVGIYGPSAVLVLLPEATPSMSDAFSTELASGSPPLACNTVMFPGAGGRVEELIAAVQTSRAERRAAVIDTSGIIVKNAAMKAVMDTVKRLAQSTIGVLIHGETGSGKEVIAQAIHDGGPR